MSATAGDPGTLETGPATAEALLALAEQRLPGYLADLRHLVSVDSGSYSPGGVNQVADWFAARLTGIGFTCARVPVPPADERPLGDALIARKKGSLSPAEGGRRILLIGHLDTVFEDGTAARRPFAQHGPLAHGPGVSDDKGGLLAGLTALELLHTLRQDAYAELVFLATPDEEIGSPGSRALTERTAREVDAALALECARENGDLVIARKGVADFRITVTGRAAHAGIEPERGANAALAAAHLVVALQQLNDRWDGVTVNVGVVRAGTRTNIVCPEADIHVEVRATTTRGMNHAEQAVHDLARHPTVAGTSSTVERRDWCPPMEDTPAARDLLTAYQDCAARLGLRVEAAATGGVGDANYLSGKGVPTLDGLGPVGGADHSPEEWLDTTTVPARTALLAATLARLGRRTAARPLPDPARPLPPLPRRHP
ncbi:glutamate carboxypeptidase [Kitasatospora sp. MMS16-BH015]|uniref:M20 family metallopeptidase n=1 Tax=Kitasatospora sp. MMS16-BH015 TaxID=2018025 RepID=UPI000CA29443|nr:M20 family metallopeptidase [Kitasatospora sp. MMS16-BH015]AUG75889.1 glutamate carboxypeptidase [Kitasatospora sp. MMS16-BH015]